MFEPLVELYGLTKEEAAFALAYRHSGDAEAACKEVWQNHRLVVIPSILDRVLHKWYDIFGQYILPLDDQLEEEW